MCKQLLVGMNIKVFVINIKAQQSHKSTDLGQAYTCRICLEASCLPCKGQDEYREQRTAAPHQCLRGSDKNEWRQSARELALVVGVVRARAHQTATLAGPELTDSALARYVQVRDLLIGS